MSNLYDSKTKKAVPAGKIWETLVGTHAECDGENVFHTWQFVYKGFLYEKSVTREEVDCTGKVDDWVKAICEEVNGAENEKG